MRPADSTGGEHSGAPGGRRRWTAPTAASLVCVTVIALVMTLLLAAGCGSGAATTAAPGASVTTQPTETTQPGPGQDTLTTEELATFDGKDGRPAYVAVDGVVYDVSASRSWPEGMHTRCNLGAMAGRDLSAEIKQAPSSMRSLLERMPVVGTLVP